MLESGERALLPEEGLALEKHLEGCSACARFGTFWEGLRKAGLRGNPGMELGAAAAERTRLRCHSEIDFQGLRSASPGVERRPSSAPRAIIAALLVLTGLTVVFLIPAVEAFFKTQEVTVEAVLVLVLLLQNAVMLLFSPVLLRRGRFSPFGIQSR
jgi:anti-sigma factor RsiW